jgi:hypothetical protein
MTIRIPAEVLVPVDEAVTRSVDTRSACRRPRSSFIVKAIEQKVARRARNAGKAQSPVPKKY